MEKEEKRHTIGALDADMKVSSPLPIVLSTTVVHVGAIKCALVVDGALGVLAVGPVLGVEGISLDVEVEGVAERSSIALLGIVSLNYRLNLNKWKLTCWHR